MSLKYSLGKKKFKFNRKPFENFKENEIKQFHFTEKKRKRTLACG
jgi:hypothetical protein